MREIQLRDAAQGRGPGQSPGLADLAIAATPQVYGYTVLTRNLGDFAGFEVAALNPFAGLPEDAR